MSERRLHRAAYNFQTHKAHGLHSPRLGCWDLALFVAPGIPKARIASALRKLAQVIAGEPEPTEQTATVQFRDGDEVSTTPRLAKNGAAIG